MPRFSQVAFGLQGLALLLNGVAMIVAPSAVTPSLSNAPHDIVTVLGLSTLTLGVCQTVVSVRHQVVLRELLMWSVPLRGLAAVVLLKQGHEWRGVA
ncbi:hypothetical protein EJ05DRAFT_537431, partial [Pseudovirgaria hyperparasitica]